MGLYVEIFIRGNIDELWEKTQDPALHQRWDLRFSEIRYLPRGENEPQKFSYSTRIGGGLRIDGSGESTGEREAATGQRTSALKFWSDDALSLIREGSGYWRYIPSDNGLRFLTWYDYRTRFGKVGAFVDKLLFRPLLGWATAWSFDRLRLWIEHGIPPESSRSQTMAYCASRVTLAFVWIYQGIIPKLIFHNKDELSLLMQSGVPLEVTEKFLSFMGAGEAVFGLLILTLWRSRWPLYATILVMVAAVLAVAIHSAQYLIAAFNPVALNASVACLASICLFLYAGVPSAKRCSRKPPVGDS
jgi:hypothetical protein